VARSLARSGARHLVLVGRHGPSAGAQRILDELRSSGTVVQVVQADVANDEETARLMARIRSEGPPLAGIVHAAGVLDDAPLAEQNLDRLERVLAPKVLGGWNLHRTSLGASLDFFVCFSSASSVLGAAGQAGYAAANAFLDALAHHRRRAGLPALSIDWGPWAEVGMASRLSGRDQERLRERGFDTIGAAEGARTWLELAGTGLTQSLVLAINKSRLAQSFGSEGPPPLLEDLLQADGSPETVRSIPSAEAGLLRRLQEVPAAKRPSVLLAEVSRLAAKVMGLEAGPTIDPARPLRELGLDSLMAVELRNTLAAQLGRGLTATLLFDHPTLDALVNHLLSLLEPPVRPTPPAPFAGAGRERNAALTAVQCLSDEEAEAALARELEAPERGSDDA